MVEGERRRRRPRCASCAERRAPRGGAAARSPATGDFARGESPVRDRGSSGRRSSGDAGRARGRRIRVENRRERAGAERAATAARRSRRSLHLDPPAAARDGRRASSRSSTRPCDSVNTWPVLASPAGRRDARRGDRAARPPADRAREPRQPFDTTEIEEALLLHVQALSDGERAEIERAGPGGARDDRARARRSTPRGDRCAARPGGAARPGRRASRRGRRAAVRDPSAGCPRSRSDGVTFRRGGQRGAPARPRRRPPGADARGPHAHGRADLPRLRRQGAPRRHVDDARPGAAARDRPLPLFFAPEVEVVE